MRQELDRKDPSLAQVAFSAPLRAFVLGAALLAGEAPAHEPKEKPSAGKEDLQRKVAALIEQMGDDAFTRREAASRDLRKMVVCDERGRMVLAAAEKALKHPDPEIAHRARDLVDAFYNVGPISWPAIPWIDQLPAGHPGRQEIIDKYLALARSGGEFSVINEPGWPEWRTATSYYVRDLLQSGKSRRDVVALLDEMAKIEKVYCEKQGIQVP